jgi:cytosine permease
METLEKIEKFLERGEDFPREPVPASARKPWWSIGLVWIGVYICVPSIIEGLILIGGLPFWEAILAEIAGFIIFLTLMFIQGSIGTKTGLSTYMMAKESFGLWGSHLVSIIVAICGFGWFAIQARALGESTVALIGLGNVGLGNVALLSLLGGLLMMITALLGYRAIEFLSRPSVVYTFVVMIYLAVKSSLKVPESFVEVVSKAPIGEPMSFAAAISIIVGGMAMGAVISPDVMRFSRTVKDNFKALFIFVLPVAIIQPIAAMIVGSCIGSTELGLVMVSAGGILGFLLVLLGAWTSNDNNLYSTSLALSEIIPKVKRWEVAVVLGVIASFLSVLISLEDYGYVMYFFGSLTIPVIGIMVTDYYFLSRLGLKKRTALERKERVNPIAATALIIGGSLEASLDFGIMPNPYSIPPPLVTIVVTCFVYTIGMKLKQIAQANGCI